MKSEKHDIGFGFVYKPMKSDITKVKHMEVIIPIERVNSHKATQQGTIECTKPGTCKCV